MIESRTGERGVAYPNKVSDLAVLSVMVRLDLPFSSGGDVCRGIKSAQNQSIHVPAIEAYLWGLKNA